MSPPAPKSLPGSNEVNQFDRAFDATFSMVAFTMNRHIVDHMLRCARLLTDGDFESLVIWGVLAHQNGAHLMPPGTMPTAVLNGRGRIPEVMDRVRPIKLRDLAAITGIPRETVRRKLERLKDQRFVTRVSAGWIVDEARMDPDLREFTRESALRLLSVAKDVAAILNSADIK